MAKRKLKISVYTQMRSSVSALGNHVSSVFVMEFEVSLLFLGKFLKDKCQMSRRGLNDRPQCQGSLWLLKYKQRIEGLS